MTAQTEQVLREAMNLPVTERAALAERILASFDSASQDAVDAAWAAEAEDRIAAYDRGEIGSIDADEVFKKIGQ